MTLQDKNIHAIYSPKTGSKINLPFFISRIPAGFPSPADDYIENRLDLNELLVKHPASTFFVRVSGESMIKAGINSGDILIVDKAVTARNNSIIIASLNGELTVKRLKTDKGNLRLAAENDNYRDMEIKGEMQFEVWGTVIHVIHTVN